MGDLNPDFIQPTEYRPNPISSIEAKEIPVIDVSSAIKNSPTNINDEELIKQIKGACEKWGFFQVVNHGVPKEKRDKVELAAREFFALPLEEKKRVRRDEENPLGYYDSEHTKNVRDWKEIFDFTAVEPTLVPASHEIGDEEIRELRNQWPHYPPDFSNISEDISTLVAKIGDACERWGFFQVINHGIPLEKLKKIDQMAREFFALPLEEKRKVRKDEENPMGYHDTELTRNVRDWKEVFDFTTKDDATPIPVSPDVLEAKPVVNLWPEYPPEFREVAQEYAKEVERLAYKLLEAIALSLGLPADRFYGFFKDQTTSFIRLNHYPPCPSPHLALGVGRHKDAGGLTILVQDGVGGLQVRRKSDGEWARVKPTHGALIINVGDTIQVWSNDKYESVEHRVMVNSEKDRISIPYFFNPAHYAMLKPLEELVNEQNPAKYKEFNWGAFFMARKNSNFKNLGVENLLISHFRISK